MCTNMVYEIGHVKSRHGSESGNSLWYLVSCIACLEIIKGVAPPMLDIVSTDRFTLGVDPGE